MAVSTLVYILIAYLGLVQSYVCDHHQHQSEPEEIVDCVNEILHDNVSGRTCKFDQSDDIHKEVDQMNQVNSEILLPFKTTDYGVENGDVINSTKDRTKTGGTSNPVTKESSPNKHLQNAIQDNLDGDNTVPEFGNDGIASDLVTDDYDKANNETNTGLKQTDGISDNCNKAKEPVDASQSTNESNCSNLSDAVNSESNLSALKEEPISSQVTPQLNNNQNPWIILNNQQTTVVSVINNLNNIGLNQYGLQSNRVFVNVQNNPQSVDNFKVIDGNTANFNGGTVSYIITNPSGGKENSGVNNPLHKLNNIPVSSISQVLNGEYVVNTFQLYNTVQLSDGKTVLVPNNDGQPLIPYNGLVDLVPINSLQASVVEMQYVPVISQTRILAPIPNTQMVFQGAINN